MNKIAITGSIGSGKSTVLDYFKKKGYHVISSDDLIKEIYNNPVSRNHILRSLKIKGDDFKEQIIRNMRDPAFNRRLKNNLYPVMNRLRNKKILQRNSNNKIFFEVPLLFEENANSGYDKIILIKSNFNSRIKRILKKGKSLEYFMTMNRYQQSDELKEKKTNIVILNNGSVLDLYSKLSKCEKDL